MSVSPQSRRGRGDKFSLWRGDTAKGRARSKLDPELLWSYSLGTWHEICSGNGTAL